MCSSKLTKEQAIKAVAIYDAIKIIENYCCSHYGTCEIKKIEKINEEEDTC